MNDFADAGKTNPNKPNFKGKKMPKPGYFALILTHFTEQHISNASS